jgi:serine/threonine protein kinase
VEIAGALAYLHSHGVLHGDLTGNNVLLNASMKDRRKFVAMVRRWMRGFVGGVCVGGGGGGLQPHHCF